MQREHLSLLQQSGLVAPGPSLYPPPDAIPSTSIYLSLPLMSANHPYHLAPVPVTAPQALSPTSPCPLAPPSIPTTPPTLLPSAPFTTPQALPNILVPHSPCPYPAPPPPPRLQLPAWPLASTLMHPLACSVGAMWCTWGCGTAGSVSCDPWPACHPRPCNTHIQHEGEKHKTTVQSEVRQWQPCGLHMRRQYSDK